MRQDIKTRLSSALEAAMRGDGLTKARLAKQFDLTDQAIGQWFSVESGSLPEPWRWPALAQSLNVNLEWLLSGEGEREIKPMQLSELNLIRRYQQLEEQDKIAISATIDALLASRKKRPFATGE